MLTAQLLRARQQSRAATQPLHSSHACIHRRGRWQRFIFTERRVHSRFPVELEGRRPWGQRAEKFLPEDLPCSQWSESPTDEG